MDQLLFGTILFTLVAFLFPTILVYYALFAMVSLVTIQRMSLMISEDEAGCSRLACAHGDLAGFLEPLPSILIDVTDKRSVALTRSAFIVTPHILLH